MPDSGPDFGDGIQIEKGEGMTTHAELAARLLREAANFYRAVGNDQPEFREQMERSAGVYEDVAVLVEKDPEGVLPETPGV